MSDDCRDVLVPEFEIQTASRHQQLAWASLLSEQDYSELQKAAAGSGKVSAGAGIGVPFLPFFLGAKANAVANMSYAEWQKNVHAAMRQEGLQLSTSEAAAKISSKVSASAFKSYVECLRIKNPGGAVAAIKNYTDRAVAVDFRWTPYPGGGKVRFSITPRELLQGGCPAELRSTYEDVFYFRRDRYEDFLVTFHTEGSGGASVSLPADRPVRIDVKHPRGSQIGTTRRTAPGYLVVVGEWAPWGMDAVNGAAPGVKKTSREVLVFLSDAGTGDPVGEGRRFIPPYMEIPAGTSIRVCVDDSHYEDNAPVVGNELEASLRDSPPEF